MTTTTNEQGVLYLHFDTSTAEGNKLAEELQDYLRQTQNVELDRVKSDDNTQDAGAILAIILGAKSIIEIAKGISKWLQKKPEGSVTISTDKEKTKIVAQGVNGNTIEAIVTAAVTKK
jgi:hypothetical protein